MYETNFLWKHFHSFLLIVQKSYDSLIYIPFSERKGYRFFHGKPIQYSNNPDIPTFCQCDRGWSGQFCTIQYTCNCASDSVCLGVSASNRSIKKFGPRCLLTNRICQNNSICQNGGQCVPSDEYLVSKQTFICLCRKGFVGDRYETAETKLILSFDKNIV